VAVGLVVIFALVWLVGVHDSAGRIGAALSEADTTLLAVIVGSMVGVLLLRGLALWVLLGVIGHRTPVGRVLYVYLATVAVSTVVPGGRAGGAPINGYLISQSAGAEYEDGVAATLSNTALSNVVIGIFGLLGVMYLLVTAAGHSSITSLALSGVALISIVALCAVGLWHVRHRVGDVAVTTIATVGRVATILPGASKPDPDDIATSVERFGVAVNRIRNGTVRQFVLLVGLLGIAHGLTIVALWLSFVAVGEPISIGVITAVIPAGLAAAVVPTPGGFGSVELALVGLLASGTSAALPIAGVATVIYQVALIGPALLLGGGGLAVMLSTGQLRDVPQFENRHGRSDG
jgi:uncharacterized protein (TIRG00374 family)